MFRITIFLLILSALLQDSSSDHGEPLPKEQFDNCVKECGKQLEACTVVVKKLWTQFIKNKSKIVKVINNCCLRGQDDHSRPSNVSFATCVRNNCNAQLWGCVIKKRHSGFYSKEEQEYIKQKEAKSKQAKSTTFYY